MKKRLCGYWHWLADNDNRGRVIAIATVAGVLVALAAIFIKSPRLPIPPPPGGEVRLSVEDFQDLLEIRKREVTERLAKAHGEERAQLESESKEVKRQLSDVNAAHAEALSKIRELESSLDNLGVDGDIDDDRLAEIRTALEEGDLSKADALLAEIENLASTAIVRAAAAAFQRGEIAALQIRWDEAANHFDKAARLDPTYDYLNDSGRFAERTGQYKTALRHFESLLRLSRQEHGEQSARTANALSNLAVVLRAIGRYEEAESLYRQALKIGRETVGERHPGYATWLNNLAEILQTTGRYEEAEPLYRQALQIGGQTLGEKHPEYAIWLSNFANLLRTAGRYDEAEPLYRQALEISREALGEKHPKYATLLNNFAGHLRATERYEEAESLYRQALDIFRASMGDDHPNTQTVARNYVRFLRVQFPGNPKLAELEAVFGEDVGRN